MQHRQHPVSHRPRCQVNHHNIEQVIIFSWFLIFANHVAFCHAVVVDDASVRRRLHAYPDCVYLLCPAIIRTTELCLLLCGDKSAAIKHSPLHKNVLQCSLRICLLCLNIYDQAYTFACFRGDGMEYYIKGCPPLCRGSRLIAKPFYLLRSCHGICLAWINWHSTNLNISLNVLLCNICKAGFLELRHSPLQQVSCYSALRQDSLGSQVILWIFETK